MGARALAAVLLAASVAACDRAAGPFVERLEVRMDLRPDGSLEVHETWLVDVDPGRPAVFTLKLPREHHDGLSNVQPSPPTPVEPGRAPSVRWSIGPGWGAGLQSLSVRYVAASTLSIAPGQARLFWPVLARTHPWRIKQAYLLFKNSTGVVPIAPGRVAEPD